jgi:hypothetical protein
MAVETMDLMEGKLASSAELFVVRGVEMTV